VQKNFKFIEIYGVSVRTDKEARGWTSTDTLRSREEESNFSRFCADVFYGRSHVGYPPFSLF